MATDEHELRSMLKKRADDVTASPELWARIEATIASGSHQPDAPARVKPRVAVVGGIAAAALVAVAAAGAISDPSSTGVATRADAPAAQPATTASAAPTAGYTSDVPATPWVWPRADADFPAVYDPVGVATAYLQDRTGVVADGGEYSSRSDDGGIVRYSGRDGVDADVTVVRAGNRWFVEQATSDLLTLRMLGYDGRTITGELTAEPEGSLLIRYGAGDGNPQIEDPHGPVAARARVSLDQPMPGEDWVTAGGVLQAADGTFAVSEGWQRNPDAAAVPDTTPDGDDTYAGIYPAYSGEELAGLDDASRADDDTTYTEPRSTATAFLGDMLFPQSTSEVSYSVGESRSVDALNAVVDFTLSDGGRGTVAVRKASPEARIWYVVTAETNPSPAVVRVEGTGVTVEPAAGVTLEVAELQPLPGGDLATAEPADHLWRFEDVTDGIVKLVGVDSQGRTSFLFARVSA